MTKLERFLLILLVAAVAVDVALLATDAGDADDPAQAGAGEVVAPASTQTASSEPGTARCRDIAIPERPSEPVICRTASATLRIVDQADPLVLGDTHVRILSAWVIERTLTLRLRVRNETPAEQRVQAGGQELYLNVAGRRVDAQAPADERVPPATGKTLSLPFELSAGNARALTREGGRAELGVRPWTSAAAAAEVGVIRFRVRTGAAPPETAG